MNDRALQGEGRLVTFWLNSVLIMVIAMVVLGGVTRLTGSGLSMVDWRPITGWLPPLSFDEWQKVFTLYQASPQYQEINTHMSLEDFKEIFWLEYFHRLWGRMIGVVYGLPLVFFLFRRQLPLDLKLMLLGLFVLGGVQGGLGWYMVKSGLVADPEVSQYRLLAHLSVAFVIIAVIVTVIYRIKSHGRYRNSVSALAQTLSTAVVGFVFMTVCAGALVAGTRAGLTYNTFPLMDGMWVPDGLYVLSPGWVNHFENITTIQFQHRVLACLSVVMAGALYVLSRNTRDSFKRACSILLALVILQAGLGILTLVLVVPIPMAALHQLGGVILFVSALLCRLEAGRGRTW